MWEEWEGHVGGVGGTCGRRGRDMWEEWEHIAASRCVLTLLCYEMQHVPEDGAALQAALDAKAPAEGDHQMPPPPPPPTGQPHSPLNRYSLHLIWGYQGGGTRRICRSHTREDANYKMAAGITVTMATLVHQCQHLLQAIPDGHTLCVGAGKPSGGQAEGAHAP